MFGQIAMATAVTVDGTGNVFAGGSFQVPMDLGDGTLSNAGSFVAKLDPNGNALWSKAFGAAGSISDVSFVAADSSGNVIVVGTFSGTINCGGGSLATTASSSEEVFVAKLDASGNQIWSESFGDGTNALLVGSLALDGTSGLVLAGTYDTALSFGGTKLTAATGASGGDFVVALDATAGGYLWSKNLPLTTSLYAAVDSGKNVVLAGAFSGSVDFGGGSLVSAGGDDIVVARLDPSGNHLWSERFGSAEDDEVSAASVDASGAPVIAGFSGGAVDFGGAAGERGRPTSPS